MVRVEQSSAWAAHQQYVAEHGVNELLAEGLAALLEERPSNPAAFLALHFLRKCAPDAPVREVSEALQSDPNPLARIGRALLLEAGAEDGEKSTLELSSVGSTVRLDATGRLSLTRHGTNLPDGIAEEVVS